MKVLLSSFFVLIALMWLCGIHIATIDAIAGAIAALLIVKFDAYPDS